MKARKVNEALNRGGDPLDTMGVGMYYPDWEVDDCVPGDKIELQEDLYDVQLPSERVGWQTMGELQRILKTMRIMPKGTVLTKEEEMFYWSENPGLAADDEGDVGHWLKDGDIYPRKNSFKKLRR